MKQSLKVDSFVEVEIKCHTIKVGQIGQAHEQTGHTKLSNQTLRNGGETLKCNRTGNAPRLRSTRQSEDDRDAKGPTLYESQIPGINWLFTCLPKVRGSIIALFTFTSLNFDQTRR